MKTKTNEKLMLRSSVQIEQLRQHPKNIRRDVGDVTELAASIKAQGIMQNLLIVPVPEHEETLDLFWVVIGNRRLAAAKMAGLEKLPCTIATGLTDQEQLELMLVENLQRRDLTPQEEAQAYEQLTLDFGLSAEQIAEKTGVSASTIRRRLKINELDPNEIESKDFQLSIGDYAALDKVKDKKLRNQVLKTANSSENLHYLADRMAKEEDLVNKFALIRQDVADMYGVKMTDQKPAGSVFVGTLDANSNSDAVRRALKKWDISQYDELYFERTACATVAFLYGHEPLSDQEQTAADREKLRQQKRDRDHKYVLKQCREMASSRHEFIINVLNGIYKLPAEMTEQDAQDRLWCILRGVGSLRTDVTTLTAYWSECEGYQVNDNDKLLMAEMPAWKQMLAAAGRATDRSDFLCEYGGGYRQEAGETLQSLVRFLGLMGYSVNDQDEKAILEGIHDAWENAG